MKTQIQVKSGIIDFVHCPSMTRLKIIDDEMDVQLQVPKDVIRLYGTLGGFCERFAEFLSSNLETDRIEVLIRQEIEADCSEYNKELLGNFVSLPKYVTQYAFMSSDFRKALDAHRTASKTTNSHDCCDRWKSALPLSA